MQDTIRDFLSKAIFILVDLVIIAISLCLAYYLRGMFGWLPEHDIPINRYVHFYQIYIIVIFILAYEGIYTQRYDFWHETRLILKAITLSAILLFAYLAMTKSIENYSRLVIGMSFILIAILLPIFKIIVKNLLYKLNIWHKKAKIYANDPFLIKEIYGNRYLGYIEAKNDDFTTIFINSKSDKPSKLKDLIENEIKSCKEVIFTPILDDYDLTHSQIYELSNTRTNLIVFKNRLKVWYLRLLQTLFNYILVLILLPILLPLLLIIAIAIKLESKGSPFFIHHRVGKGGKLIPVIKFRSMYCDAKERLDELLEKDPKVREEWERCFKIKDDPRVTKVGKFLRKTSLDELPQILNVMAGHMNFVGPRPVVQKEIENYYKDGAEYYKMVKPGITGLWQVSGRSDTDYDFRVKIDKWYVLNWSLWLDIVILFKTVKVVLKRDGAY